MTSVSRSYFTHIALVALAIFVCHGPTLTIPPLLDDLHVLGQCERFPLGRLFVEGFHFHRGLIGNAWWIPEESLAQYFRPLLLCTFKVPQLLFGPSTAPQHFINLLCHVLVAGLLLALARRFCRSSRAALLATLFFAVCPHHGIAVGWICTRKELLVGAGLAGAFLLVLQDRRGWAALPFGAALLCGEHAVCFPALIMLWDVATGQRGRIRSWVAYLALVGLYFVVRTAVLGGFPIPVPPYYTSPFSPASWPFLAVKEFAFLFALATSLPYLCRAYVILWLTHPLLFFACIALVVLWGWLLWRGATDKRRLLLLLGLAWVTHLPFVPMFAAPFYLYSSHLFYCLALAVALDGVFGEPRRRRLLPAFVVGALAVFMLVFVGTNYTSLFDRMVYELTLSNRLAAPMTRLFEKTDRHRNILIVDFPVGGLHAIHMAATATDRSLDTIGLVWARTGFFGLPPSWVTRRTDGTLHISNTVLPMASGPMERQLLFFREGLVAPGRTFRRGWFSVTITRLGPPPPDSRGMRFFTNEPGVEAIDVRLHEGAGNPLVIGFEGVSPRVLFDE